MPEHDNRPLEMRVGGIVVDPNTQAPVVVLRGRDDPRLYLPIFIGGMEASAIATALAKVELPRPMTHDLMTHILGELGCRIRRTTVTDLRDGTFFAELLLADDQGHEWAIDARPSDSIALALRAGAPIFVAGQVLAEAGGVADEGPASSPDHPDDDADDADDADDVDAVMGEDGEDEDLAEAGELAEPAPDSDGPKAVFESDARLEDLDPELFGKYKM